jgi:hypothetical protein
MPSSWISLEVRTAPCVALTRVRGEKEASGFAGSKHVRDSVPSIDEYAKRERSERLQRLELTADQLRGMVRGRAAELLARRPAADAWAPVEVVCHLRDSEEWFVARCRMVLDMNEPAFPRNNPDRWARERQYLRHDVDTAIDSFRAWRVEAMALFRSLGDDAWARGGVHTDSRGRRTLDEFLTIMAWHDDNHLDQLKRALKGQP